MQKASDLKLVLILTVTCQLGSELVLTVIEQCGTGGSKEMSSILADQERPRKWAQRRGEVGSCVISADEYRCTEHRSPNKLWKSNSIFNLWCGTGNMKLYCTLYRVPSKLKSFNCPVWKSLFYFQKHKFGYHNCPQLCIFFYWVFQNCLLIFSFVFFSSFHEAETWFSYSEW